MLLMFVVGMSSLVWMLMLAIAMAIEKNARLGRYLTAPLGLMLLICGVVTFVAT
jgi:predicted metal-binding membrane protein